MIMQNKKPFMLTLFLTFMMFSAFAQSGTVSGNVSDADGPLIGATIKVVGTATGTVTDLDGNYSLDLSPGDYLLEATYTGFASNQQRISVTEGENTLNFTLEPGVVLTDIVVTGTRSNPRTTLSSPVPIDNFTADIIDKQGNGDLTENLKNVVPSFTAYTTNR